MTTNKKPAAQRKLRNYLLMPFLQIKIGIYTILLTLAFTIVFSLAIYLGFHHLADMILNMTDLKEDIMSYIKDEVATYSWYLFIISLIYVFFNIVITIIYTHKLVGPTIAFRRHIKSLISGDYSSRVILRDPDAFKEVADELNQLAETLEKKG